MPTTYIKKLSKEGKGSVAKLEKEWEKAKAIAKDEGYNEDYGYITTIFKSLINIKASVISYTGKKNTLIINTKINSAFKLLATQQFAAFSTKALEQELDKARLEVNKSKEGSIAFNKALAQIRILTEEINSRTDFDVHKSTSEKSK